MPRSATPHGRTGRPPTTSRAEILSEDLLLLLLNEYADRFSQPDQPSEPGERIIVAGAVDEDCTPEQAVDLFRGRPEPGGPFFAGLDASRMPHLVDGMLAQRKRARR